MNIVVLGTGYVGLVTGTCFSDFGNKVICVDIDANKIDNLNKGVLPIYEPGLEELISENVRKKSLSFTNSIELAIKDAEVVFIAVGTPMLPNGSTNMAYVKQAAQDIANNMVSDLIVVNKSTVPVGSVDIVKTIITDILNTRKVSFKVDVVSNPEFLKEGAAIEDCMRPDRVIIGSSSDKVIEILRRLYAPFTRNHDRFITMDVRSAELTKYVANAFLATKISFINEMANIAERLGADINQIRIGIGSDKRIGYHFIYPGLGYGGSCFPKDINSLLHQAKDVAYVPKILQAVEETNQKQRYMLLDKIMKRFNNNIQGKRFAIWGLTFKPNTNDMRESPAITIIQNLEKNNAHINVYDPKAIEYAKNIYLADQKNVTYYHDKYESLSNADALIIITEWKEFRLPDFTIIKKLLNQPIVFDGRNLYNPIELSKLQIEYFQIGVVPKEIS